jgi:hypothetical protein
MRNGQGAMAAALEDRRPSKGAVKLRRKVTDEIHGERMSCERSTALTVRL